MIAVIPTVGESAYLPELIEGLFEEGVEEVLLTVNEPGAGLPHFGNPRVTKIEVPGSIYAGWNVGIRYAAVSEERLLILNDDVVLEPAAIGLLDAAMSGDPSVAICGFDYEDLREVKLRYTEGTYREHGVGGWAFAVDAWRVPLVDEQFEWWYGDDDLVKATVAAGLKAAVAEGCRAWHEGSATASRRPWTEEAKERDAARFREKWETET